MNLLYTIYFYAIAYSIQQQTAYAGFLKGDVIPENRIYIKKIDDFINHEKHEIIYFCDERGVGVCLL